MSSKVSWFKFYNEFFCDANVQMMKEADQRRLIMLLSLKGDGTVKLSDDLICFSLRITLKSWLKTKSIFISKGFLTQNNDILYWANRQKSTSSVNERMKRYRERKKNNTFAQASINNELTAQDSVLVPSENFNVKNEKVLTLIEGPAQNNKHFEQTPIDEQKTLAKNETFLKSVNEKYNNILHELKRNNEFLNNLLLGFANSPSKGLPAQNITNLNDTSILPYKSFANISNCQNKQSSLEILKMQPKIFINQKQNDTSLPPQLYQDIIKLYNEVLHDLPRYVSQSQKDILNLKNNLTIDKERSSLKFWEQIFTEVRGSPFLMGEVKKTTSPANLGWLLKSDNIADILNGKYHDQQKNKFKTRVKHDGGNETIRLLANC